MNRNTPRLAACLVAAWLAAGPLLAHEGEDHGAPPPAVSQPLAPRFEAASGDFALLGVLEGSQLVLYLDRYATNEPVSGARIELESGAFKGAAQGQGEGTYVLPAASLAQPGNHALVVSIETGKASDLLNGTLQVGASPGPVPPPAAARAWPGTWLAGAGGLALATIGWLAWRRRSGAAK